jgi:hypothetical protein
MKYISPQAASDWIRALGTIEAPYSIKPSPLPWKQYPTPETASPVNTLVKRLVDAKSALLVFNDWSFYHPEDWQYYKPHQLGFVEAMRGIASQHPGFSQGLALFFDAIEHDELTSHVSVSLELGWSVYLYPETASATVFFWEGDLIDVWSQSRAIFAEADRLPS